MCLRIRLLHCTVRLVLARGSTGLLLHLLHHVHVGFKVGSLPHPRPAPSPSSAGPLTESRVRVVVTPHRAWPALDPQYVDSTQPIIKINNPGGKKGLWRFEDAL